VRWRGTHARPRGEGGRLCTGTWEGSWWLLRPSRPSASHTKSGSVDGDKNKRKRARGWLEPGRGLQLFLGFLTAIPGKGQQFTTSCCLALSVVAHPSSASLCLPDTAFHLCDDTPWPAFACVHPSANAQTRFAKQVEKNGHLRLAQSVFHLSHTVGNIQAFVSTKADFFKGSHWQ